jgi:hypothetical protein
MNLAIARRKPNTARVVEVRPLVPADLEHLRARSHRINLRHIKNSHHNIARLAAAGLPNREIARRLGYTESRISVLLADPSIMELVATYRREVHESWRESVDQIFEDGTATLAMGTRMQRENLEELDERGERPPLRELIALNADLMDRFGYGKKQTNVNVNVDFAKRLEKAISQSRKVIEHE